jgi:hypothetical protein
MQTKQNTHLPLVFRAELDVINIDRRREWGSAGGEGGRDPKVEDVCRGASPSGGEEATLGGLLRERGSGTMAASWTVRVLVSMAGGRGGGGGRTVAVVLPFLHHGEEVKVAVGDF